MEIEKLFGEDEDETMHSEADVEVFQAALNRDIEGYASTSQPFLSNTILPQGSHQTCAQVGKAVNLHSQQVLQSAHQPEQNFAGLEQEPRGPIVQQQQNGVLKELNCLSVQKKQFQDAGQITGQVSQTTGMPTSQRNAIPKPVSDSEAQCLKLQEMAKQQTSGGKKVFAGALMRTLLPQLDRGRAMHFQTLYEKMKRYEITEEVFVQHTRDIVGKEKLWLAVNQQTSAQQNHPRKPSFTAGGLSQFTGPCSFAQLQKSLYSPDNSSHASSSVVSVLTDSSYPSKTLELQTSQLTHHQSMGSISVGESTQAMNMMSGANFEKQNSINDLSRLRGGALNHISTNPVQGQVSTRKELYSSPSSPVTYMKKKSVYRGAQRQYKSHLSAPQGSSIAQVVQGNVIPATSKDNPLEKQLINSGFTTTNNMMPMNSVSPFLLSQLDHNALLSSQNPSITSPAGVNARTPQRKPPVGQKKQLEARDSSPPSKKQKISESEQSIEQISDVTAFVNLQEEAEQLLSGRNNSRVSAAARKVAQEEEERGILLKTPLRKKLAEIMAKFGLKNISNDVERCLSMGVEERMHGLICNLIRLSKQRVDTEKPMHLKLITSDVRQQINELNRKAKEEWEEKKAEVEKLHKLDEPKGVRVDDDNEIYKGQVKSVKTKKEEDDKMRAAAANVVARAAVGIEDMLSKWQHTAELAHQKREMGIDAVSSSQATSGAIRKFGRSQELQTRVPRTISVEDMIAVLESEPQMYRSRLIYLLYEKIRPMAA